MTRAAASLAILALAAACGRGGGPVAREVDGITHYGRYIPPRAYAEYAKGAYLEARGEPGLAAAAYRQALAADPDSPELWARIAALACRARPSEALRAFERAFALEPGFAPTWHEQARCRALSGDLKGAIRAAERAAELDPNRDESTELLASLYERDGRTKDAVRWRRAHAVRRPHPPSHPAAHTGNATGTERAHIDAALVAHDLQGAQRLALLYRMPAVELALRACALGAIAEARAQGDLLLAADPTSADARVAALVAADLGGRLDSMSLALADPGEDVEPPSALAVRLFSELLARHAGDDAARLWLQAHGPLGRPEDDLEARVQRRTERWGEAD